MLSAEGAQYDSQGQALSAAKRVAPGPSTNRRESPERGGIRRPVYFGLSGLASLFVVVTRGDALRCAQRLPLAIIFRAFGASQIGFVERSAD